MAKFTIWFAINLVLLVGCAPPKGEVQRAVETGIAGTQLAWTSVPTYTKVPTSTLTPTPSFVTQSQVLGPIWDSLRDSQYTIEVTLDGVEYWEGDIFERPRDGSIFTAVALTVRNLGPGTVRGFGSADFQVRDANNVIWDSSWIFYLMEDCELESVDLLPEAVYSGCITFEVLSSGRLELIYAPYRYEGLTPGRYLSFLLRE